MITGGKEDICYATQNRQDAVKTLAKYCELIIVIGSSNSSNSNRLVETSKQWGVDSFIIDLPEELDYSVLKSYSIVGVTSGASVPDYLNTRLVEKIKSIYQELIFQRRCTLKKTFYFLCQGSFRHATVFMTSTCDVLLIDGFSLLSLLLAILPI